MASSTCTSRSSFLRHLLLHAGQRHGDRWHRPFMGSARLRPADRHRHRGRIGRRGPAVAGVEEARFKKPEQQKWYAGETISIGIGQGYNSYTPIQLAQATATIANNGVMYPSAPGQVHHRQRKPARKTMIEPEPIYATAVEAAEHRRHQAGAGRRQQGRHRRPCLCRRRVRSGRQDRHGAGLLASRARVQGGR
jgi:hypothetical protein